jgi:hypothetical protein
MHLLTVALSRDGYRKVTEIMRGDEMLKTGGGGNGPGGRGGRGGGGGPAFGEAEYYLAFLGTPSTTTPWMLQFGGHHLAINLTLAGSQASMTPSLPAAQPATYTVEGREIRPLGKEQDQAFALINGLDASQRGQAILPYRVSDLVLGPGQDGRVIQPGMGRHRDGRVCRAAHGRDPREPGADLLRLERTDDRRQRGVFPDSGPNAGD